MQITKAAIATIAAACVTVGAAAGYLATRSAGPDTVDASPSDGLNTHAADGVEQSEAFVEQFPVPVERAAPPPEPPLRQVRATPPPRPSPAPPAPRPEPQPEPDAAWRVAPIMPAPIEPVPPVEFEPAQIVTPAEPRFEELVLSGDSVIGLQVETGISTETAQVEDEVVARVTRDVKVGDQVAIPAGSRAHGEVVIVERGGKMRERARLGVRFTSIVLVDGTRVPIVTQPIYREGDSPGRESATKIGGGAIGGAILGGILGGAKGAAIGGSIGAGAGSAVVLAGDRNPATLSPGSPVTVRLEEEARVVVPR